MEVVGSYRRGGVRADQVVQRTLPTDVQRLGVMPTHGDRLKLGPRAEAATAAGSLVGEAATDPLLIVASMGTEDRVGDVIDPDGWDLTSYVSNPVFLWAHRRSDPPIGRSVRTWVEDNCLKALIEFAPTLHAQSVRTLYAGGYMRGISVGFRPLKWSQRAASNGRRGTYFTRQELLEISAAPVPMHPDTLARDASAVGEMRDGVAVAAPVLVHPDTLAPDASAAGETRDGAMAAAPVQVHPDTLARDANTVREARDGATVAADADAGALRVARVPAALEVRPADVSEVRSMVSGLRRELEALY